MKHVKRFLALSLAAALLAGCVSCGNSDEKTSPTGGGSGVDSTGDGGTLRIAMTCAALPNTDSEPTEGQEGYRFVSFQLYDALVKWDASSETEAGKIIPGLATSWEQNPENPKRWTFHLREGVTFSNGTPFNADSVLANFDRMKKGPFESSFYGMNIDTIYPGLVSYEKTDDYTVVLTLSEGQPLLDYTMVNYGSAIFEPSCFAEDGTFAGFPIGTGPYKHVEWKRGDSLEFEMFEDYWDEEHMPSIKHMIWKIIPEGSSRTIALEAGEVDYIVDVEAMDVERLEAADGIKLDKIAATNHMWMMVNNEVPGLDNVDVRRAMNCAINKEDVVQVALNNLGTPSYSMAPDNMPGATDENTLPYDPEKAKEYMAASGVDPADVKFSIICSNDQKKRAGEVVQANLKEVLGIECEIESMDLATYLTVTSEGNYTAAIGNYSATDMIQYLVGVYHTKSIGASNRTRLNSPEVDALIDKAAATIDPDERAEVLSECIAQINDLCPQVPLYQDMHMRAYNENLGGVIMYPGGTLYMHAMYWK